MYVLKFYSPLLVVDGTYKKQLDFLLVYVDKIDIFY